MLSNCKVSLMWFSGNLLSINLDDFVANCFFFFPEDVGKFYIGLLLRCGTCRPVKEQSDQLENKITGDIQPIRNSCISSWTDTMWKGYEHSQSLISNLIYIIPQASSVHRRGIQDWLDETAKKGNGHLGRERCNITLLQIHQTQCNGTRSSDDWAHLLAYQLQTAKKHSYQKQY